MRTYHQLLSVFLLAAFAISCNQSTEISEEETVVEAESVTEMENPVQDPGANPPAAGFDMEGSDPKAIAVADRVVIAHGGRRAYDDARFFRWDFFGARTLNWDKKEQRVRIDQPSKNMVYLVDYSGEELSGKVRKAGDPVTNPDSLAQYLQQGYSMFINDSYWLVQPFKLKDSGVTLKYIGQELDPQKNRPSDIIDLTFSGVGDTPNNRYRLYVDGRTDLINTWQFFRNADDEEPAMETPFNQYRNYGGIQISGDRSGRFQLTSIQVADQEDESLFTEF